MTARRFPRPWRAAEHTESFEIQDAHGEAIAYVYFADDAQRRSVTRRMARDEARRIAVNVARLPDLLATSPPRTHGAVSKKG